MNWNDRVLELGFRKAKDIHARYGTSYFFATRLFPKEIRSAVHTLYAFFRIPDEIVDSCKGDSIQITQKHLETWRQKWSQAYQHFEETEPVLYAASFVFHQYHIPFEYSDTFFQAMAQDVVKTRYQNYAELEQYMYGSAAVVGLMLSCVIGYQEGALAYAEKLGYAMQLTNFLRDIQEDVVDRARIYMPQDELAQFQLQDSDIIEQRFSEQFRQFMSFQIHRARRLYQEAEPGIDMLNKRGQNAVRVASRLYAAILDKLEQQQSNPFLGRARTSKWEKVVILSGVLLKNNPRSYA